MPILLHAPDTHVDPSETDPDSTTLFRLTRSNHHQDESRQEKRYRHSTPQRDLETRQRDHLRTPEILVGSLIH
jgi:hypothetical protein